MDDNVDVTQKTLGMLVNRVAEHISKECNDDLQLMIAVARDFLFQAELAYRCSIIRVIEKKQKAKTE